MSISRARIIAALKEEQALNQKGAGFEVIKAAEAEGLVILVVRPQKGLTRVALDESLEGSRIRWGPALSTGGIIKMADPDHDRLVVHCAHSLMPAEGDSVRVFPNDFLGPLIDL